MLQIDDKIVSFDLFDRRFVCQLSVCKGQCCVEGDAGAPLLPDEVRRLRDELPRFEPYLTPEGREAIRNCGVAYKDKDGDDVTTLVNNSICAFAYKDEGGCVLCAIERAFREGKTTFRKPLSCALYPVRLTRYPTFTAVNVHEWSVCKCAFDEGKRLDVPVFRFLKQPLIEAFGSEWYEKLEIASVEYVKWRNSKEE